MSTITATARGMIYERVDNDGKVNDALLQAQMVISRLTDRTAE